MNTNTRSGTSTRTNIMTYSNTKANTTKNIRNEEPTSLASGENLSTHTWKCVCVCVCVCGSLLRANVKVVVAGMTHRDFVYVNETID